VLRILTCLAMLMGLAACGGGGGEAASNPDEVPEAVAPGAATPATTGVDGMAAQAAPPESPASLAPAAPVLPAASSVAVVPVVLPPASSAADSATSLAPAPAEAPMQPEPQVLPAPETPAQTASGPEPWDPDTEQLEPPPPLSLLGTGSGVATVSWTPPGQRTDGSPLMALGGYRILFGTDPAGLTEAVEVGAPGIHRYLVEGLPAGLWYFGVMAVDDEGRASELSALAAKLIE